MEVLLNQQRRTASAGESLQTDGKGLVLTVRLGPRERLAIADLWLTKPEATAGLSFPPPQFSSDQGSATAPNINWVSADWGSSRTIASISFRVTAPAAVTKVTARVRIATGGSQWYCPPGPTSAVVSASSDTTISFPNAVADRVMLEFVDRDTGAFVAVTLNADPHLDFGDQAKDLELSLQGKRPFFRHDGCCQDELAVPKLLDSLREQLRLDDLRNTEINLLLTASVAGLLRVKWNFVCDELTETFLAGSASTTLSVPWDGCASAAIPLDATAPAVVASLQSLEFDLVTAPVQEYLAVNPVPEGDAVGEIVKPLFDAAQRLDLGVTDPILGVMLWGIPRSAILKGTLEIVADRNGSPQGTPISTLPIAVDDPNFAGARARWLGFDCSSPAALEGPVWIVLRLEQGEFCWLFGARQKEPRASLPYYRRNEGTWLGRDSLHADRWALLRLRALSREPAPAPELRLVVADDSASPHSLALTPDADGHVAWVPSAGAEPRARDQAQLQIVSRAARQVTLSNLRLCWRRLSPPA